MKSLCFLVLFIFSLVLIKSVYGTLKTPVTCFTSLWLFVGFISNLGLYDYFLPSDIVNIAMIAGSVIFFVAYSFFIKGTKKSFFVNNKCIEDDSISVKVFTIINVLCILFTIPTLKNAMNALRAHGSLSVIRGNIVNIYSSNIISELFTGFIRPVFIATTLIFIVYSFGGRNKKYKYLLGIFAIIETFIMAFISAGRAPFVNFAVYYIIALIMFKGERLVYLVKKEKKKIFFIFLLFIGVLYITQLRSTDKVSSESLWESLYIYYFSGPSYMSQLLKNNTLYGPQGKLLYGTATFGFITNIFAYIYMIFTGKNVGSLYILGSTITNHQHWVGEHTLINAMCTAFYPFIVDWGYIGIIIGPIVTAGIVTFFTLKLKKKKDLKNFAMYVYIIYVLIRTVFKWDLLPFDMPIILITTSIYTDFWKKFKKKELKRD